LERIQLNADLIRFKFKYYPGPQVSPSIGFHWRAPLRLLPSAAARCHAVDAQPHARSSADRPSRPLRRCTPSPLPRHCPAAAAVVTARARTASTQVPGQTSPRWSSASQTFSRPQCTPPSRPLSLPIVHQNRVSFFAAAAGTSSTVTALYTASPLRPRCQEGARKHLPPSPPNLIAGDPTSGPDLEFSPIQ
jgi:hypothetical protein